jgi:hypothetical protein
MSSSVTVATMSRTACLSGSTSLSIAAASRAVVLVVRGLDPPLIGKTMLVLFLKGMESRDIPIHLNNVYCKRFFVYRSKEGTAKQCKHTIVLNTPRCMDGAETLLHQSCSEHYRRIFGYLALIPEVAYRWSI